MKPKLIPEFPNGFLTHPTSSLWTKCHQVLRCAPALIRGEFSARIHRGRSASPRAPKACLRQALGLRYSVSATSRVASDLAPCHDVSSRRIHSRTLSTGC